MTKFEAQEMFNECGIDEDVEGVINYIGKSFEPRVEIMTERVAYDVSIEKIMDSKTLGTEDIKQYILGSQI